MSELVKSRSGTSSDVPSSSDAESKPPQSIISSGDHQSSNTDFVKLPPRIDMNSSFSSAAMATTMIDNHQTPQPIRRQEVLTPQPDWSTSSQSKFTPMAQSSNQIYSQPQSTNHHHYHPQQQAPLPYQHQVHLAAPRQSFGDMSSGQPAGMMPSDMSDISDIDGCAVPDSLSLKVHMLTNRPGTSTPTRDFTAGSHVSSGYTGSQISGLHQRTSNHRIGTTMSAIESENAALRAELEMINSDRNHLHQVNLQGSSFSLAFYYTLLPNQL